MSPLSVGQFLQLDSVFFDLVIFDEASQVKPEDAIGTIMRGRQVIVVGDNKQLPPTNFFEALSGDDFSEDDDNSDTGLFESILDLCGTLGLPERMLKWHYRSRREGLIAFSNNFLYDNRLVTFPSPDFDIAGTGVEFRHIADGIYDRSHKKTNAREVQEIVAIVCRHARENPDKSLGVVAFSQAQMKAIDSALWRLRRTDLDLESFVSSNREEPFFVKNLENVQGDERDVILFSVGYGRDAVGKLEMKFGPLNNRGGERRLNVAITRAKEKIVLVSSIRGADIDLSRTQSEGVRLLKRYLDYAEKGVMALEAQAEVAPNAHYDSEFERQVAEVLKDCGYQVHSQVGCSGYRIDLAIVHPSRPGQYAIGIECDGASYHSAATARDRDRLREQILVELGWQLYHIWSTDWFRSRSREVGKLRLAVDAAIAAPERPFSLSPSAHHTSAEAIDAVPVEPVPQLELSAPDYLAGLAVEYTEYTPSKKTNDFYASPATVKYLLIKVVDYDGPIRIESAVHRVAGAWNIARAGQRVQEVVRDAIEASVREGSIIERNGFLYAPNAKSISVRRYVPGGANRKVTEIAPEEIDAALLAILRSQITLALDDLIVATARLFGFERTGTEVRKAMQEGVSRLMARNGITEENGAISEAQPTGRS